RVAHVGDYPGELVSEAEATLRLGQKHHPSVRGDPAAIEGSADLFPRNRWQVEGQRNILIHQRLPLLDRCAASGRGIMPHIHASDYVRLLARADEVIA